MGSPHNPEIRKARKEFALKTVRLAEKANLSHPDFLSMVGMKNWLDVRRWSAPEKTNYPTGTRWENLRQLNILLREAVRKGEPVAVPTAKPKPNGHTTTKAVPDAGVELIIQALASQLPHPALAKVVADLAAMLATTTTTTTTKG